jgi:long-chain acyl-CoA synthetase
MKLGAFIAAHATSTPDKIAVRSGADSITFRELDERSDRLAAALARLGLVHGDRIALFVPSSIEFVLGFAAAVKGGFICVPVSNRLTAAEVSLILDDCRPRVILLNEDTRDTFRAAASSAPGVVRVACRDAAPDELDLPALIASGAPGPRAPLPVEVDDCMICYTSGTTGRPKGAIITHANVAVLNGFVQRVQLGLTPDDVLLATTSIGLRTGFARLGNMLGIGCTLVVMPRFDVSTAAAIIERQGITVLGLVPTVARMMLSEIERDPARFASLRVLLATGEAFPLVVKERLVKALPRLRIFSYFGMTEAGVVTCLFPEEQFTHPASLGRPIPGVEVRLTGDDGTEVAPGEVGEMWARTGHPGTLITMRGYFNRPEANAETIVDGWLRTGDLARFDADGYLYIVDRKKDMVLSGGMNIYSKEVEGVLLTHPSVRDAAIVGVPDEMYGEAVAAYLELEPGATVTDEDIIAHCRQHLASYKKPKYVRIVDELPRNSSGKTLKYRLRESFAAGVRGGAS